MLRDTWLLLDSGTGDTSGAPGGENQGHTELVWRPVHVCVLLKSGALPAPTWVQISPTFNQ